LQAARRIEPADAGGLLESEAGGEMVCPDSQGEPNGATKSFRGALGIAQVVLEGCPDLDRVRFFEGIAGPACECFPGRVQRFGRSREIACQTLDVSHGRLCRGSKVLDPLLATGPRIEGLGDCESEVGQVGGVDRLLRISPAASRRGASRARPCPEGESYGAWFVGC
jgi:hypothetical protein